MLLQITLALTSVKLVENQEFNAFEIVLVGFLFVFCVLLVLTLATSMLGKIFSRIPQTAILANAESKRPLPNSKSSSKAVENDYNIEESDPHYIAVIAAAVHCAMDGQKHRIVSIRSENSS